MKILETGKEMKVREKIRVRIKASITMKHMLIQRF